jgi:hypothetical protein
MLATRSIALPALGTLLFWLVMSAPALAQTHC